MSMSRSFLRVHLVVLLLSLLLAACNAAPKTPKAPAGSEPAVPVTGPRTPEKAEGRFYGGTIALTSSGCRPHVVDDPIRGRRIRFRARRGGDGGDFSDGWTARPSSTSGGWATVTPSMNSMHT